jgi:hypothetical protein
MFHCQVVISDSKLDPAPIHEGFVFERDGRGRRVPQRSSWLQPWHVPFSKARRFVRRG